MLLQGDLIMFNKTFILQTMVQILFGMLGALIIQFIFVQKSQQVVTVDIIGLVKSFENELLKQKLPETESAKVIQKFGKALDSTVSDYSNKKHLILLPKQAVIAGDLDKTDEIKALIKQRLNQ